MGTFQEPIQSAIWLTEKDAGERTKLSLSTLRSQRFYGKAIPYVKIGRSVRYALEDMLAYMEDRKVTPRS